MQTLLVAIFEHLKSKKIIYNQADFGRQIGVSKGYMSQLMKQSALIPQNVQTKLNERFSISLEWLASNGKQGNMIEPIIPIQKDNNNEKINVSYPLYNGQSIDNEGLTLPFTNDQAPDAMTLEWLKRIDKSNEHIGRLIGVIETLSTKVPNAKNEAEEAQKSTPGKSAAA